MLRYVYTHPYNGTQYNLDDGVFYTVVCFLYIGDTFKKLILCGQISINKNTSDVMLLKCKRCSSGVWVDFDHDVIIKRRRDKKRRTSDALEVASIQSVHPPSGGAVLLDF